MSDKPILFSAPMVRALLAGTKTQTRRIAKVTAIMGNKVPVTCPEERLIELEDGEFRQGIFHYASTGALSGPYHLSAKVGDRLWVREAFRLGDHLDDVSPARCGPSHVWYEADGQCLIGGMESPADHVQDRAGKLRPSIFMRRNISRLTLIVTDVRVERLQDISEEDARAEGVFVPEAQYAQQGPRAPILAYAALWESINGPGSWDANPWVAAYTFRIIPQNIDTLPPSVAA